MAIFYWQIDQQHSLSTHHKEVRFNILFALIMLESPNGRATLKKQDAVLYFLELFTHAWLESAMRIDHAKDETRDSQIATTWKTHKYDLIRWSRKGYEKMVIAVKALEAKIKTLPPPPFDIDAFWTHAKMQPPQEFRKHSAAWALQYVMYKEKEAGDRIVDAQDSLEDGSFVENFGTMAADLGEGVPGFLTEELFQRPWVQALLVDVREGCTLERPQGTVVYEREGTGNSWMTPEDAMMLIEGKAPGLEDVVERLRGLSFLE